MSFTLGTLKTAVQNYMQVDETTFNANLDEFIRESEDRIFSLVQLPEQRRNVAGLLSQNNRFLATPTDFYAPFSLAVIDSNKYHYLIYKHPSFLKEYSPDTTVTGRPKYYSLFDQASFALAPVPSAQYNVELHYLFKPNSITLNNDDAATTLLSTEYSDALLYGTLAEAAIFLKETPDVVASIETRFNQAVARMKNSSEGRASRDEYRYDLLRTGVT